MTFDGLEGDNTQIQIGEISEDVVRILSLPIQAGTPIYLGKSNLVHMQNSHPRDFRKYGSRLARIISEPDYIGIRRDGTIEYIKAYGMHIKVAVRVSLVGEYFARTLYHVDANAAKRLISSKAWVSAKVID